MHIVPDVFVIPDDGRDSYILYAPLLEIAVHVNRATAALVARLSADPDASILPGEENARAWLTTLGVLSEQPYPNLAPDSRQDEFVPTSVSLFLTTRCNLGCTYCYASANEAPVSMTWPLAKQGIDLVLANAAGGPAGPRPPRPPVPPGPAGAKRAVGVLIHGGGEASLEWDLLQRIVRYTRAEAQERGIASHVTIGTNGVMPAARAAWLAESLDGATVSLDGLPDVHNKSRPTVGGNPSYDAVLQTLRIFDERRFAYGLRLTVGPDWVDRLPEAVEAICGFSRAREIQAEPLFPVGRAERNQLEMPTARRFITAFRKAEPIARAHGRRLSYSGARLGVVSDRFCEAAGRSFAVTPNGEVSSCYEVSESTDPRFESFLWGRFDEAVGRFELDEARRREQTRLTVHGKVGCADCFCKWHCAGDCSAKLAALGDPTDTTQSPRCEVNRALTRDQLIRALRRGDDLLRGPGGES